MNKEELEKLLLGKCLNGFTITKVEYDPFIKEQINLITDGIKIVPPCNDRDIVIFRLRDKNTFGASWCEEVEQRIDKAIEYIKSILKWVWVQRDFETQKILNNLLKILGDKK